LTAISIKIGTRGSPLALRQTAGVIECLRQRLPDCDFETLTIETPGDKDRATDLRESPPDFFTRSLDEALRAGRIDLAVHSAKDLPCPVADDLDWFWLPEAGDRRDALIGSLVPRVIGVSSDRRLEYARKRFPEAICKSIRGNIHERLEQLDRGDYDAVIMAGVALQRLGLEERIAEWIPLSELDTPEAQGTLAVTFRRNSRRGLAIRNLFIKAVCFVGAGVSAGHLTLDGLRALQSAELCLYDALMDDSVLRHLPPQAERIFVGKRRGAHSRPQEETNTLLCDAVRKGRRTVRLKGGDPGIFGRLAEEVEALEALGLPSRVVPGISSMQTAAADTGIQLTRRGTARGFTVMTPRLQGGAIGPVDSAARAELPVVFYMAVGTATRLAAELMADGTEASTSCALVFAAGSDRESVLRSELGRLAADLEQIDAETLALPGLFIVGAIAADSYRPGLGALGGRRILLTCSEALLERSVQAVHDMGGRPVARPLIALELLPAAAAALRDLQSYDWLAITSPSSARCFHELMLREGLDLRRTPRIMVTGGGTARALARAGLAHDAMPATDFSGAGLIAAVQDQVAGRRILRLRSQKAGPQLAEALRAAGAEVADCILYENRFINHPEAPRFDAVFFASASAVESFAAQWGAGLLADKAVLAIGEPTRRALAAVGVETGLVGGMDTVERSLQALADFYCRNELEKSDELP
jgi:uroporphyrinogen III methyltransferase / synthase